MACGIMHKKKNCIIETYIVGLSIDAKAMMLEWVLKILFMEVLQNPVTEDVDLNAD